MRILLAEDEPVTRRMVEAALTREGHEVVAVADGAAAVEAFEAAPVPLVVLDWQMPKMDGPAVAARVRASGHPAFILMLTGRDDLADLRQAIEAGVDDYLVKPVTPEQLRFRLVIASQRIAADEARRTAEQELEHVRWKLGVTDAIVALQHEINNPLATVFAELELASDDLATDAERRRSVVTALAQVRRVVEVVRRIADMRQHRSVEYVPGISMLDIPRDAP